MTSAYSTDALRVENLGKDYKGVKALEGLTFSVPAGVVFGLLGPNGSGKTTLIKILTGLVRPTSGSFQILGRPLDNAVKARLGFLPDRPHHYAFLTPAETLSLVAELFVMTPRQKKERIEAVLSLVGMQDSKDQRLSTFSKGMLQRVALAQALLNDPDLLILDEPIGALDPWGVRLLKGVFDGMRKAGKTVLFSSHLLNYAQELCDHFMVLNKGRLVHQGAMAKDQSLENLFLEVCEASTP